VRSKQRNRSLTGVGANPFHQLGAPRQAGSCRVMSVMSNATKTFPPGPKNSVICDIDKVEMHVAISTAMPYIAFYENSS
jgi:hypothetical protein